MFPAEIIKNKRNKLALSPDEIQYFINGYTDGSIPDYQMSALLMAILLNDMEDVEVQQLTKVMLDSGEKVVFPENLFPVDKHSTGGVGDKTSLILAPIVAACGLPVPMMSGRGLGHTGGTLDKLESIPGFETSIDLVSFKKQVERLHLCFIGQTKNICPADKKIYALRDVTATVESLPLICASIMSKKIAEGIRGLVLDVKVGSGAFMKTQADAKALALGLINIGRAYDIKTKAYITNMSEPLGKFIGNALEVWECLSILKRKDIFGISYQEFSDTEELSLILAAQMIAIGKNISFDDAKNEALNALNSGKAFECFEKVVEAQGGDLDHLPKSEPTETFVANSSGYISEINTEKLGLASIALGAGRKKLTDALDPKAGLFMHKKIGDNINPGDPLVSLYFDGLSTRKDEALKILSSAFTFNEQKPKSMPLVLEELG